MLAMRRAGGARSCKRQKPYDKQKKSRARCPSLWCAVTEGEAPNPRSSLARQSFLRYPSPRVGASLARDAPRGRRSILQTQKPYNKQKKSRARCPSLWCAVTEGEAPNPRSSLARQSFLRYPSPRVGASLARDAPRGRRSILQTPKTLRQAKKIAGQVSLLLVRSYRGKSTQPAIKPRSSILLAIPLDNRREVLATVPPQAHRLVQLLGDGAENHRLVRLPRSLSGQPQVLEHQLGTKTSGVAP